MNLTSSAEIDLDQAIKIARDEASGGSPRGFCIQATDEGLRYTVLIRTHLGSLTVDVSSSGEALVGIRSR